MQPLKGFVEVYHGQQLEEPTAFFTFIGAVAYRDDFDFCMGYALVVETEFFSCTGCHIEDTTWNEGAAVIDADFESFPVIEIGNLDETRQRKRFVSTGEMPWHDFFPE